MVYAERVLSIKSENQLSTLTWVNKMQLVGSRSEAGTVFLVRHYQTLRKMPHIIIDADNILKKKMQRIPPERYLPYTKPARRETRIKDR